MKRAVPADESTERLTSLEFEDFFRSEYPRLASALQLLTGNAEEAEDLAQDALSRAFERWDQVRDMDSSTGYVYRTALNLFRKRLRRLGRRDPETRTREADPTSIAETRLAIREALAGLSVDQREAPVLVEWVGLSASEAGTVLGISAESVRARIHRARSSLRSRFGGTDE